MKKYLFFGFGTLSIIVLAIGFWVMHLFVSLPDVSFLKHYRPPAAAEILDKDGQFLTNYYDGKFRIWIPIGQIPDIVIQAVVTAEDDTFFEHKGVNYKATWNALVQDVQQHKFARGGSTITQQMIKNVLLSKEKTLSRKIREYILARRAEEILTKRQILEIYINEVEWGENIYGIEAASRFYFDKHASEMNVAEASLLAGMLPNPHFFDPFKRLSKARERQERVLFNMQQAKIISQEEYQAALSAPIVLRQDSSSKLYTPHSVAGRVRPCYERVLELTLLTVYGEKDLHLSGSIIRTTLDKTLQTELVKRTIAPPNEETDTRERILMITQSGVIRAFACDGSSVRPIPGLLEQLGLPYSGYEVNTFDPNAVNRDEIILTTEQK